MSKKKQQIVPRNPYVAAAKFRKAGSHVKSNKAMRRADKAGMRREFCAASGPPGKPSRGFPMTTSLESALAPKTRMCQSTPATASPIGFRAAGSHQSWRTQCSRHFLKRCEQPSFGSGRRCRQTRGTPRRAAAVRHPCQATTMRTTTTTMTTPTMQAHSRAGMVVGMGIKEADFARL